MYKVYYRNEKEYGRSVNRKCLSGAAARTGELKIKMVKTV